MANQNAWKNGLKTQFSKTNQPAKNGPRKSVIREIEEQTGIEFKVELSSHDRNSILAWLLERSTNEIIKMVNSKDAPLFIVAAGQALVQSINNKNIATLEKILDRIQGMPVRSTMNLNFIEDAQENAGPPVFWELVEIDDDDEEDKEPSDNKEN